MARKEEIPVIHPRKSIAALDGFNQDVMLLLSAARNAHSFLTDKTLDAEKVRDAVAKALDEPICRVAKWYDAQ